MNAKKLAYHRARYNYYEKACRSLAAEIRHLEKKGQDVSESRKTLAEFEKQRDTHYVYWKQYEE